EQVPHAVAGEDVCDDGSTVLLGHRLTLLLLFALISVGGTASAGEVRGTVFADADGDGLFDADERGVPTVVAWEDELLVPTDAGGAFVIDAPVEGLVWARVPDGFAPGPVWAVARPGDDAIDLALTPDASDGP